MTMPKQYKYEYICCLPTELEAEVMEEVRKEVSALFLTDIEKQEAIENANCSKACDLTETIEIEFI